MSNQKIFQKARKVCMKDVCHCNVSSFTSSSSQCQAREYLQVSSLQGKRERCICVTYSTITLVVLKSKLFLNTKTEYIIFSISSVRTKITTLSIFGEDGLLSDGSSAESTAVKSWPTPGMTWPYATGWKLLIERQWECVIEGVYLTDTLAVCFSEEWLSDFIGTELRCSADIKMHSSTSSNGFLLPMEASGSTSRSLVAHRPFRRRDVSLLSVASDEDDEIQFDSKQRCL